MWRLDAMQLFDHVDKCYIDMIITEDITMIMLCSYRVDVDYIENESLLLATEKTRELRRKM